MSTMQKLAGILGMTAALMPPLQAGTGVSIKHNPNTTSTAPGKYQRWRRKRNRMQKESRKKNRH